jgi:hypothetical protein
MNEVKQYLQASLIRENLETLVLQLWKRIEPSYPSLVIMTWDILIIPGILINTYNC